VICERYETLVVPFPFAELPVMKRRPVVALSGRAFNGGNGHTLVAMITTAKATAWPSDVALRDIGAAGLNADCVVRMRFTTIPNEMIVGRIGALAALDRLGVESSLARMIID
jgi:mRNA interferase MazF